MRLIRGVVNAFLMVTLVRPIVRLTVSRWRKRAREAAPAVISLPVQELFEAALIEELSPLVVEPAPLADPGPSADAETLADLETLAQDMVVEAAGRSTLRAVVIGGGLIAVIAISAVAIRSLIRRRRANRGLVAVPVESEAAEAIEEAEAIATAAE